MNKNFNLINPKLGNLIQHEGKTYECVEATNICAGCDFYKLRHNGTSRCVGPGELVCDDKIFKEVSTEDIELTKNNGCMPLLIITAVFWGCIVFYLTIIA